jgi:hypothetical protein
VRYMARLRLILACGGAISADLARRVAEPGDLTPRSGMRGNSA